MKLVYLASTAADFLWLRKYYASVFPEGHVRAREHIRATQRLLLGNPEIGKATGISDVRELVIPRTPFSIFYRVRGERIEVLRIWDNRADRRPMSDY